MTTHPLSKQELQDIEARAEKATATIHHDLVVSLMDAVWQSNRADSKRLMSAVENELGQSRSDVLALLATIKTLEAEVERLQHPHACVPLIEYVDVLALIESALKPFSMTDSIRSEFEAMRDAGADAHWHGQAKYFLALDAIFWKLRENRQQQASSQEADSALSPIAPEGE